MARYMQRSAPAAGDDEDKKRKAGGAPPAAARSAAHKRLASVNTAGMRTMQSFFKK